ncbi:hypothetical protein JD969_10180 [Planctomycetota bacterium]|nr:hypothetical protein JD969_10180 [Planctomycetota bacterium]
MSMNRANINIELTTESINLLQEIRNWNGMTRKELVTRLIDWFINQDRVIQSIILGQIPSEIAPDLIDILHLRRNQTQQPAPTTSSPNTASSHHHTPSSHITSPDHPNLSQPANIQIKIPNNTKSTNFSHKNFYQLTNI